MSLEDLALNQRSGNLCRELLERVAHKNTVSSDLFMGCFFEANINSLSSRIE